MASAPGSIDDEYGEPSFRVQEISECTASNVRSILPLQDGNNFLLIGSDGRVLQHQNGSTQVLANFGTPIQMTFCNGSIILINQQGLGFRYILNNRVSLREFACMPSRENQCFVEVSRQEASTWSAKLQESTFYSGLVLFAQKCEQKLEESDEEFLIIEVEDARGLIKDLSDMIQHYNGIQAFDEPLLSYGTLFLDKLRFFVDPFAPYNSANPPRFSESVADAEDLAHFSVMNSEAARRLSFYKWRRDPVEDGVGINDCLYATPKSLAAAGFFHRPTSKNLDRVACFTCNVCLVNWEPQDDPIQEHCKHGSTCRFIQKTDLLNVPYEATLSHLPLYYWSSICENPNIQLNAQDLVLSQVKPETNWFAVSIPSTTNSQQNKPSIFLFDTAKVANKPIEILLDLYATCMVDKMGLMGESFVSMESKRSFDWLNSVEEKVVSNEPLCQVKAMCTSTSFDECTVTLRGERIVGVLCTAVSVDENRIRSIQDQEEIIDLTESSPPTETPKVTNEGVKRRPFILIHHIVEFPDDNNTMAVEYANAWSNAWATSNGQANKYENFYTPNWPNDSIPTNDSPIDALVLYDDKSDSYAEITKESSKDLNEEVFYNPMNSEKPPDPDHVPIYYHEKKPAAIGIQCVRLPGEFDSTDYQIDCIVSSASGNLIVAAINRQNPTDQNNVSSALLIYSWVSMLKMIQEVPVAVIPFRVGKKIKAVHVLGKDYFGSANVKRDKALSTEALNDTACLLFEDGSLELVDLDFGHSVRINVGAVKSVNVTATGDICALTQNSKIFNVEVQQSIPSINRDFREEFVISLLSVIENTTTPNETEEPLAKKLADLVTDAQKLAVVESALKSTHVWTQPSSFGVEQLAWIWNLIKTDSLVRSHAASVPLPTSPLFNSRSHVSLSQQAQLQSNLGLTVQMPNEFVEFNLHNAREPSNPTILTAATCQQFCVLNKIPYSDLIGLNFDASRSWQIKPRRESSKKSYVFELSMIFGLNLSHLNLTLGLGGFVRGVSDIRVSIYLPRTPRTTLNEEMVDLFGSMDQAMIAGPSNGFASDNFLELLSAKAHLLEQKFERCFGPYDIAEFADTNGKQATIQLSVAQLLLAAAKSQLNGKKKEASYNEGWMFRAHRFYVHVEVSERRTIQQKAYHAALQNSQSDQHRRELFQSVGGSKRTRAMDTPSGGFVPLPYKTAAERKKQQLMKGRSGSSRKRFVHVSNLVAESVAQSALKQYTSSDGTKSETILSCLEFVHIGTYKATDSRPRANMERCLLATDYQLSVEILKLAAGIVPKTSKDMPYYRVLIAQQQAFDLLIWLLTQWRVTRNRKRIEVIATAAEEILPELIHNCFVVAPRSIARKANAVLAELLELIYQKSNTLATRLLQQSTSALSTKHFRFPASLQWLTTLVRMIVKNACLQRKHAIPTNDQLIQAVVDLNKTCSQVVQTTGKLWRTNRSNSSSTTNGINVDSLDEIRLYDAPPLLAILVVDPVLIETAQNNARLAFSTFKNATSSFAPKNDDQTTTDGLNSVARSFFETSIQFEPSGSTSKSRGFGSKSVNLNGQTTDQQKDASWLNDSTALAKVYLLDELNENEMKWHEHLGINSLETPTYPTKKVLTERANNPLNANGRPQTAHGMQPTIHQTPSMDTSQTTQSMADLLLNKQGQVLFDELCSRLGTKNVHRFLIGSEQIPGLNEVERLCFTVTSATCQLRILDLNASTSSQIPAESPQITVDKSTTGTQGYFGFPSTTSTTKTMRGLSTDLTGFQFAHDANKRSIVPAQSKNLQPGSTLETRDSQLKSAAEIYLLERQRAIYEKSQADKHTLPPPLTSSFVAFAPKGDELQQLHANDSKISSAFLSFDEMESDLFGNQMDVTDDNTLTCETVVAESADKRSLSDSLSRRSPVVLMEILEGCQSGQLIQVVLDFEVPFLLTDLIVPANELFSAVAIDGWLQDEKHATIRFAYSTEIENRSLVLNDLTSSQLIRYIRLSFTTRDSRRSSTTFMLGHFYGTRFFSPWHLYSTTGAFNANAQTDDQLKDPFSDALKFALDQQKMNFKELDTSITKLFARYQSNVSQLKKALKQPGTLNLQRLYQKCLADRQTYNCLRSIVVRSQLDMHPASNVLSQDGQTMQSSMAYDWFGREKPLDLVTDSWKDATPSELHFVSVELMSLANEVHYFLGLSQQAAQKSETNTRVARSLGYKQPSDIEALDLETAVRLFGYFVCSANDRLQATCCGFLFHHGSRSSWWPEFFPTVIRRHFVAGSSDSLESIFILLAYICNQSVRHHELHTPIIEKLVIYLQELVGSPKTANGSVDTTQLSWLLLLISSAFDIIVPNTKHSDRWAFMSGQSCTNYPQAPVPNENFRRYSRKIGNVNNVQQQFWSSHYHSTSGFATSSSNIICPYSENSAFLPPVAPMPSYQKYTSSWMNPDVDHATIIELKKLGSEIRHISKQLDTLLHSNQLVGDDYTALKKEQKNLSSLYNTAHAYISRSPSGIHDSFVDKVLITGLEKSELDTKAPLATQEEDFLQVVDDSTDSAAKKQQQIEAMNANNVKNRLNKVRRSLYTLVKQAKNASRNKTNTPSQTRSRRFAIRLQLTQQLIVPTIRSLMRLIADNNSILSDSTQILLFKVCAKLSVHGSRNPIAFHQIVESVQTAKNLMAVVIENSVYNEWIMHALVNFLLDICESENPSANVGENSSSPTMDFTTLDDQGQSSSTERKAELLAMKNIDANLPKDTNGNVEDLPMEADSPNAEESTKKRRKETPTHADNSSPATTSGTTTIPIEDKDLSPMEEENACSASTSTFMTNLTNIEDDETFSEAKSALNNLAIVSPTLTTSGLVNDQTLVSGLDLGAVGEERELHLGLMDERSEIGDNPRYPFAFPLFDRANESDVDLLILMSLFALRPLEKTNPAYWDSCRGYFLRQIGFAVARARYEKGHQLSEIFRWFDYVLGAELEAANNCKSENSYIKWALLSLVHAKNFIEREFDLNGKLATPSEKSPSHSALTCASYFSQYYYIHDGSSNPEMDEDPMFDSLDDQFNDVFSKMLTFARGGNDAVENLPSTLRSMVEHRRAPGTTIDLPDEQSELNKLCEKAENYLSIDASEEAAHLVAVRGFMPLHKAIFVFSKLRFIQSLVHVMRSIKNLSYSHLPELNEVQNSQPNKKDVEKSRRRKSMTKARHPESPSDSSSTEKPRHVDGGLDDRMHYNVTINVNFLNSRACPLNLGFDHSPNLDIRIMNIQRRLMMERLVSNCHFLHKMAPTLQRTVKTSAVYDTRAVAGVETCASMIIVAINRLLSELNVEKANEMPARTHRNGSGQFLTNLLNFFWEFQGNVIANNAQTSDAMGLARTFILNEKAIGSLMHFAVEYEQMTEQIWHQLLKILNALDTAMDGQDGGKDQKSYKFTHWVENSPYFARFIEKFLQFSMGKFSMVSSTRTTYGPAVQNIFSRFVLVVFKQITGRVMDDILQVLTKIIRNSRENGYVNFPTEMIFELASSIDKLDRTCSCTPSIFAEFLSVLTEFTSDFFIECNRIQRHLPNEHLPQTVFTTEAQPIANNVCFSAVLSSSSMHERNMSSQERLRIHNPSSSSKHSKNITFSKRSDLLENMLRDGEVTTKDQFTIILYSLLRLSVRFVSQYKPQVVKAILQEHPKSLSRAVDMLFTFVSCTSNVDEITVENFKIVTLSDAVIHLLLVISETVEEPDSCRLFIRLIINFLRDRVNLNTDQPGTVEESMENKAALMDLPLPVLLLMKSLLRGVTRCQIFVDEGGHTFVADQLQRSLDSVAHDWTANSLFPTLNRQLNTLTSNITGVEFMNPLLNSIPPSQVQPSTSSVQQASSQTVNSSSSIMATPGFQNPLPEPTTSTSNFALNFPTVSLQPPSVNPSFTSIGAPFSMQILNIKATCLQPTDESIADDLFNFAPISSFRSDLISPAQLAVLNQNPDLTLKRNRGSPTFTFRYPSRKQWFDVTMALPYKIVLHEIIIRGPDNNSTVNAPSAVQVELSSDPAQASWNVLSCPVISDTPNFYRISTSSYHFPITGARIHFGCPTSSNTIQLTQIQLLGSTSIRSMRLLGSSKAMLESQLIYHWVSLFSRLCKRIDVPVWNYAPKLAESLIKVYLGEDHNKEVLRQVYDLLAQLDQKSKTSLVTIIVKYLLDGGRICPKAYPSAAELLYATCIFSSTTINSLQRFSTEKQQSRSKEIVVLRQRELLIGIQQLLAEQVKNETSEEENCVSNGSARELSIFLWSAACVIWHNFSDSNVRYDTIALCLELGPSIIPKLAQFLLNITDKVLYQSSCWFLCTMGRSAPELLAQIFKCLELTDLSAEDYSISVMRILGKVCQSTAASKYLIDKNLLSSWATTAIEIAREEQHIRIDELTAIVNCFKELAIIDVVAEYFEKYEKSELLFRSLIRYVSTHTNQRSDQSNFSGHSSLLDAVICFIQRCLSCTSQRERIAAIMAQVLKTYLGNQKGAILPKPFEEMISRLIVADERVTVRLTGVSTNNLNQLYNFEDQMMHPLFGCMQDDRVMKIPLNTLCQELLPHTTKLPPPTLYKAKKDLYDDYPTTAQLKMVLGPEELDDKEIIPTREVYPDSQKLTDEYPFMFKQFAIQLACGEISTKHALNNQWTIETVMRALQILRRPDQMEVDTESGPAFSRGQTLDKLEREDNFNDGYYTLTLRVKSSLPTSMLTLAEQVFALKPYLTNIPQTPSTLEHFAKFDGLKYLARAVNVLGHVDGKLKMLQKLVNPLPDQQYGQVKNEIQTARKSIAESSLRKIHEHGIPSEQADTDTYRALYEALQQPSINIYNASRILNTQGVQLSESEVGKLPIQPPKPSSSGGNMAFTPYDTFDSIDGLSTSGAENEDTLTMSMVDFLQNEVTPPPKTLNPKPNSGGYPKPFTSISSHAIGLISAMQIEEENMGFLDSANNFSESLKMLSNIPADPTSEQFYTHITAQLQGQLAELTNKLQAIPGTKDGTYVVKVPVQVPMKRARYSSYSSTRPIERIEHILVALSLFLEIDTYGQVLVEYDTNAAKRLIYLLIGIDPPLFATSFVSGLFPLIPQSQTFDTTDLKDTNRNRYRYAYQDYFSMIPQSSVSFGKQNDLCDLSFVPFIVLSRCFESAKVSTVGAEKAQQIRIQALNNGTMDVILALLSYYSNQKQQKSPMRPSGDLVVNQLISRLNIFYTDFQAIIQIFNDSKHRPINKKAMPTFGQKPAGIQSGGQSSSTVTPAGIAFGSSASSKKTDYWAKGTGFGFGSTAPSQFNLNSHLSQQKSNEEVVTYLLNIITNFVKPQSIASTYRHDVEQQLKRQDLPDSEEPTPLPTVPSLFVETIKRSCLSTTVSSYLMNDSVLDISQHVATYESVVGLLLAICSSETVVQSDENAEPVLLQDQLMTSDSPGSTVYDRLKQLCVCIDVYISKLRKPKAFDQNEEGLDELLKTGSLAFSLMEKRHKIRNEVNVEDEKMEEQNLVEVVTDAQGYSIGNSMEKVYEDVMRDLQYDTVSFLKEDGVTTRFPYHYAANFSSTAQTAGGKRTKRLAQEAASLLNALPLNSSSTVFVRVADERLDTMKVLISGPNGSPYENGIFEFDVFFPNDYPNVPMQMNLMTTGNRSVRFNPNLYDDGKVCLSILNTWSGRPEERWNAQSSSFLQVLVSIQSLILVPEPFYNEPGFERTRGTPSGEQSSRDYTANIRHQSIRWAMIEHLRKPPTPFADIIRRHFWLKRDEICLRITEWIRETKEMVAKYPASKQLLGHQALMEKNFEALINEFIKLECPSGLEQIKSKFLEDRLAKKEKEQE